MQLFWEYLKPYKSSILLLVLFLIVQSACEIILPALVAGLINHGIKAGDTAFIRHTGLTMLLAAVIALACSLIASFISARTAVRMSARLRQQIFFKIQNFSSSEIDNFGVSSLITRTTNDISRVQTFSLFLMKIGILTPLMMISGLVMAIVTGKQLSLVLIVTLPAMIAVIAWILLKTMSYFKSMQTLLDSINLVLRENLTGIRIIRAFQRTVHELNRFEDVNRQYTDTSIIAQRLIGALLPAVIIIMNLTTLAVMYLGSKLVIQASMDVGSLVAYVQYITQILISLMMTSMIFIMYPRLITSLTRIAAVLNTDCTIVDGSHTPPDTLQGVVEFNNVSFTFPDADTAVLKDISFIAHPGRITAIIGSTGSGKSTIAKLLLRFYDTTAGQITIDGVDIKHYHLDTLRSNIGYVPQKAVLFSNTIAGNLRFGNQAATDEQLLRAANLAQAAGFIHDKPQGLATLVSQGGVNLSGGQKQRLALARAIVKKPPIYLLDDSFSALDYKTDAAVRKSLRTELQKAAFIVIAQRISTIQNADHIVVLDQGRIVGSGTHQELAKNCNVYQEIVKSQRNKEDV